MLWNSCLCEEIINIQKELDATENVSVSVSDVTERCLLQRCTEADILNLIGQFKYELNENVEY